MGATVLVVIVINGNVMKCNAHGPGFTWFIKGYEFQTDLRILKFGKYDMVLGVD
jgi:hypothetical protein